MRLVLNASIKGLTGLTLRKALLRESLGVRGLSFINTFSAGFSKGKNTKKDGLNARKIKTELMHEVQD